MIVYELGQFRSYAEEANSIPVEAVWDLCWTSGAGKVSSQGPHFLLSVSVPVSSSIPVSAIRGTI